MLRAAWALTLTYFCGQDEVVLGATTSGRNMDVSGIDEVVDPCINTVPFRIKIDAQDMRSSLLYLREYI